ncbi:kinase-like domain-containing protein [Truncatella angustata]|uniref:EKC/KEOPS complex subunit BUD32 n=1 Tax=Truncatella angustata TaxID=152316 RepID=A0A9P8UNQ1_9PEZI|nr:kinase-like domain-containing protein [Truncatella angustata]KAH6655452.1 kinase-like domain-containing protein [Truncatella angustata]
MAEPIPAPVPDPAPPEPTIHDFPLPLALTYPAATEPALITQGAEGRLYKSSYLLPSFPCALKHRPSKPYRHPLLDAKLTRHRILAEARILQKCRREGVAVPALYAVDEANGVLAMEWVPGAPVRVRVNEWIRRRKEQLGRAEELLGLMRRMGEAVGKLHKCGVVHGDLTTSNMMLRPWEKGKAPSNGQAEAAEGGQEESLEGEIVIIDFGLASQGTQDEDRAVDLYVLERAFGSTHPKAEGLFSAVLDGYRGTFKGSPVVLKKLEDVRMRGRKRSMLG